MLTLPRLFRGVYTLVWIMALPVLALSPRLRTGWKQRMGWDFPKRCDVWIQGASAGECALTNSLLEHLADTGGPTTVLATAWTKQGVEILAGGTPTARTRHVRFFPFDLPFIMRRVLDRTRPRVVVLMETELWPGLLSACADRDIPVIVINGRLSTASLAGYLWLRPVLRDFVPCRVNAIAKADARRFDLIFGAGRAQVTGNMKFDRALHTAFLARADNPLADLFPEQGQTLVLGSIREEEEAPVLKLVQALRHAAPQCIIALFPRHLPRCAAWRRFLAAAGIPAQYRSELTGSAQPGQVIVWDRFGELAHAYALAHRAFVGGSLAKLGGQNFLEPLSQGVLPAVGPHLRNFAWIGDDIFHHLAKRHADPQKLARVLLQPSPPRREVLAAFQEYVRDRRGATAANAALLQTFLTQENACPKS